MQNQYGWNLLETPIYIEFDANTTKISLVDLPPQTRKVKLSIYLSSGYCQSDPNIVSWTLSTKVDIIKIKMRPYIHNALSYSSENCELRLDEKKIIEVSRKGNFPSGNFNMEVEVLAYK